MERSEPPMARTRSRGIPGQLLAIAAAIDAAVAEQATHFDMLGLQLGYVYETPLNPGTAVKPEDIDPTPFTPTGEIGARLPHAWLADGRSLFDALGTGWSLLALPPDPAADAQTPSAWSQVEAGISALQAAAQARRKVPAVSVPARPVV